MFDTKWFKVFGPIFSKLIGEFTKMLHDGNQSLIFKHELLMLLVEKIDFTQQEYSKWSFLSRYSSKMSISLMIFYYSE